MLLHRLIQVMRRVGLRALPSEALEVLREGRSLVKRRAEAMVPSPGPTNLFRVTNLS